MGKRRNQNLNSSTKPLDVQQSERASSQPKPLSNPISISTSSTPTPTPTTSSPATPMQKENIVKPTIAPIAAIPESPAPSSATTLRESPLIPQLSTLKPGSYYSSLSPLEQEPDGLFSKAKEPEPVTRNVTDLVDKAERDVPLSPELKSLASLLLNMKGTLRAMQSTAVALGRQTEKVASLAPAIEARDELSRLREVLEQQKKEQSEDVEKVQRKLEEEVKEAIKGKLREEALKMLSKSVGEKVHERVQQELNAKVPQDLRHQIRSHKRQVLEVKTNIHNMNARSFNSNLRSTTDTLRPLLRPLPSSEQSPAYIVDAIGESSGSGAIPTDKEMVPTPSENFPTTLGELWNLSADRAKQLVVDYGLGAGSPSSGSVSVKDSSSPLSAKSPRSPSTSGGAGEREDNINKFMDHIGVPFKMLPVPVSASRFPVGQRLQSPVILPTSDD